MYKLNRSIFLCEDLQATSSTHLTRLEGKQSPTQEKRMFKLDFFFSNLPFLGMYSNNQHLYFLVHGHYSWSTPSEGSKALKTNF